MYKLQELADGLTTILSTKTIGLNKPDNMYNPKEVGAVKAPTILK